MAEEYAIEMRGITKTFGSVVANKDVNLTLRRGEILALQWDDLDFRTGVLRVERQVQRIRGKLVCAHLFLISFN